MKLISLSQQFLDVLRHQTIEQIQVERMRECVTMFRLVFFQEFQCFRVAISLGPKSIIIHVRSLRQLVSVSLTKTDVSIILDSCPVRQNSNSVARKRNHGGYTFIRPSVDQNLRVCISIGFQNLFLGIRNTKTKPRIVLNYVDVAIFFS